MIRAGWAKREDIDAVLLDPEIYERISDDHCPALVDFTLPETDSHFIAGYVGGEISSLFVVHGEKLHFMVLKDYRCFARELLAASFVFWPYDVYCEIPTLYPSVINFARKFGFKDDGVLTDAHLKDGKRYDKVILRYRWDS